MRPSLKLGPCHSFISWMHWIWGHHQHSHYVQLGCFFTYANYIGSKPHLQKLMILFIHLYNNHSSKITCFFVVSAVLCVQNIVVYLAHNIILWDLNYLIECSRIFSHSNWMWEIYENIPWNTVNPTWHCCGSESLMLCMGQPNCIYQYTMNSTW